MRTRGCSFCECYLICRHCRAAPHTHLALPALPALVPAARQHYQARAKGSHGGVLRTHAKAAREHHAGQPHPLHDPGCAGPPEHQVGAPHQEGGAQKDRGASVVLARVRQCARNGA